MLKGVTVGCGYFSRIQMEAWRRVERASIVAACDLDQAKLQDFALSFGVRPYQAVSEMLDKEKPGFVDIATRPSTHLELVREAVSRGIPVLLQKPLANTWEESAAIVGEAENGGVRLMVNENWRWQRWYREIAALLASGRIGECFTYSIQMRQRDGLGGAPYPNQPYFKEMPRFLILETLVHMLDTARFLFGDFASVYCHTAKLNPVMAGEDFAQILTVHAGGVKGLIDGNRAAYPDQPGPALDICRFEGFDGTIHLRQTGEVMLGSERVFDGRDLPGYRGDSCHATQQHFVDRLIDGQPFETEGRDYLMKTFAAVEACYRSAAERRPVALEEVARTG